MSIALTPWVIGQQIKAAAVNLIISAVQEAQTSIAALQLAQAGMQLSQTPVYTVPNNAWTILPMNATPDYSAGVGLTGTVQGIQIGVRARYQVSVQIYWAINTTGNRGCAVGITTAPVTAATVQTLAAAGPAGSNATLSQELSFNAGDVVCIYGYQNSGAGLSVAYRQITVRQMPD